MNLDHEMPLVSAVIPTHNRPGPVSRAAVSALRQTYRNLEVVVVIDGPDPATLSALRSVADPRLRIVALQETVGGSEARNIGIRNARGTFVALLDDDDEWLPGKISAQFEEYRRIGSSNCIVACDYIKRKTQDIHISVRPPRPDEDISEYMFYTGQLFRSSLTHLPVTDCYFARRDIFLRTPFRRNLRIHQDWDWLLRSMSHPGRTIVVVNKPLAIVHCGNDDRRVSMSLDWRTSLDWAEESRDLFTPRAYSGFITDVCMRRVGEIRDRIPAFLYLIKKCKARGCPPLQQLLSVLEWFFLAPCIRRSKVVSAIRKQFQMACMQLHRSRCGNGI